jgi:hypothetical protein
MYGNHPFPVHVLVLALAHVLDPTQNTHIVRLEPEYEYHPVHRIEYEYGPNVLYMPS